MTCSESVVSGDRDDSLTSMVWSNRHVAAADMWRRTGLSLALCALMVGPTASAAPARVILRGEQTERNLLKENAWRPYERGHTREEDLFICDNGRDAQAVRGVAQTVVLNQDVPRPIVASGWSKAFGVGGSRNADYSLYLDLVYTDGTPLWGQVAPFAVGSHDWQRREVVIVPAKPVKHVSFYLLLRRHAGRALFRDAALHEITAPDGAALFDNTPVLRPARPAGGFLVRDVAADSDWYAARPTNTLGLTLTSRRASPGEGAFIDATIRDTTGRDRAITLTYTVPLAGSDWTWFGGPRTATATRAPGEYRVTTRTAGVGTGGGLSRYPLAAVANGRTGRAIGIDMAHAAFFRVGYSAGTRELYVAYDLGLTPETPAATVRFCTFPFDAAWGFRSALSAYTDRFPAHFRRRVSRQGQWMPFARVSAVKGWQDFGFRFKEGTNETAWDDAHDLLTFRYTEPQTWWMRMPADASRTMDAALRQVNALAAGGNRQALAFASSAYHDEHGKPVGLFRDTPWCDGIVWSMNTAPGIRGAVTHFGTCWNASVKAALYGPDRKVDQDGEYVDSSEGYVTAPLDFRREHFSAMQTPLTFSGDTCRPAIFRGLVVYEYIRSQAADVHGMGKLMMANGTPGSLCWLAPWLDVMGTETDWHRGKWQPMSDSELMYRRALCGSKPYCFLMNTDFDAFSRALVEKYMKRCLAYGMFPGFFSHNASEGHYFTRPELYDRDRALFKTYVPLCRRVAEAGWQPVTRVRSRDPRVYVERFGERLLTVFNDSPERRTTVLTMDGPLATAGTNLVTGRAVHWQNGATELTLDSEDVAVIELGSK